VLLDPDPGTLNLAEDTVLAALSRRTSAVIVVHLHGRLAPTARLTEACRTGGVAVLEDAAQAHGARGADGRRAGALGLAGCFSFHPSKNLGAFGDAGMITTSDRSLAGRLAVLRNLGKTGKYEFRHVAPNSKLDTLQAAILRVKLRRLDAWNAHRRVLAAAYREQLAGTGDLVLPPDPGGESHVWHQFAVRTARREELRGFLESAGIRAGMHYPIPPHLQRLDLDLGYRRGDLPVTEEFARTCLSLPISHELGLEQVGTVCERIRRFFRG
jgi:dTDP-4-amino-4,6-dideoxygalactose transaminase